MDVTFKTPEGRFNYRVCAILLHDGKLLAMHDDVSTGASALPFRMATSTPCASSGFPWNA